MRARSCGMSREERETRRLNYCGTCKAIGADFGSKARFLLDHDAVFLAEILGELSGESFDAAPRQLRSRNCLSLPKDEIPFSLRFAAVTNVVLAGFKLDDHVADDDRRFKYAQKLFARDFAAAEKQLAEWSFPHVEIRELLASQTSREANFESLDDVAFPTAQTTATFFREGAKLIGREDSADAMFALGFQFGRLVYLLDAFEDFEKDARRGKFNAFRSAFGENASKRKMIAAVRDAEFSTVNGLRRLPIAENRRNAFAARLSQNLDRKLKTNLPVIVRPKASPTLASRWRNASVKARSLTSNYGWRMPLAFVFVFACALVVPAQTRDARSARECYELSFNLMFLGAFAASVVAFPKTLLIGNRAKRRAAQTAAGGGGASEGGGGCCDWCGCCSECACDSCDCCDGCDCCGSCDCCDCSCDC